MKIGIIGSNGFIGSNISSYLKKIKGFEIYNFSSYRKHKSSWQKKILKQINFYKPELIINCAASQYLFENKKTIRSLLYSNLYSNIFFLFEAIKNRNFKGYITFGSKFEYDNKLNYRPLNFYASVKHANDFFLKYFSLKYRISTISLKIFDTYGKNDKRKKILNLLLNSYKKNKTLSITEGNQFLDYVNINDISLLLKKICNDIKKNKLKGFNMFTVSSKNPVQLKTFVNNLIQILDKRMKVKFGAKKYRLNEHMLKIKKTKNYPGWSVKYNLMREVKKIFDND